MAGLSDEAILMLTKLDQARMDANNAEDNDLRWIDLDRHPKGVRAALMRAELIERKPFSKPPMHAITVAGQRALKMGRRPENEPAIEIVRLTAEPPAVSKNFAVQMAEICSPNGRKADTCAECIYRQAVDILAAKVPGVRELVDALQTIDNGRR